MSWLLETPWTAIVGGVVAEIWLGVMYFSSGRARLLGWMAIAALLTGGLVLLEWLVETDREQITASVQAAAAAVERGDVDAVLAFVAPSAETVRLKARGAVTMRPTSVRASILKLEFLDGGDTPHARLNCLVMVSHRLYKGDMPVKVEAYLRKYDGKWLVYDAKEQLGL